MRQDGPKGRRDRPFLSRWILSWMPDVKVLAPKGLRDHMVQNMYEQDQLMWDRREIVQGIISVIIRWLRSLRM